MGWTGRYFPFGTSSQGGVTGGQGGVVANVAADGSVKSVLTYPTPFLTQSTALSLTIDASSIPAGYELTVQYDTLTRFGANIYVAGGPAGSHVSVSWQAAGS